MEKHGEGQLALTASSPQSEESSDARLQEYLELFQDSIDSPMTQLILRNATLTLLELPEHPFNLSNLYLLLQDDSFRAHAMQSIAEKTPQIWGEKWDSLWQKDAEPLLSKAQQEAVGRSGLIAFWRKEWEVLPAEAKARTLDIVRAMWIGR